MADKTLLQEHFNIAYKAIIAQGKPALNDQGFCRYRTPDGSKCAFGHILDDADYSPTMDAFGGGKAMQVIEGYGLHKKYGDDLYFYNELQRCHDSNSHLTGDNFVAQFKAYMAALAKRYNLDVPTT